MWQSKLPYYVEYCRNTVETLRNESQWWSQQHQVSGVWKAAVVKDILVLTCCFFLCIKDFQIPVVSGCLAIQTPQERGFGAGTRAAPSRAVQKSGRGGLGPSRFKDEFRRFGKKTLEKDI